MNTTRRFVINRFLSSPNVFITDEVLASYVEQILGEICKNIKPEKSNAQDGLYLGTAGIAYMYYHLSEISIFDDRKESFLKSALEYLQPSLEVAKTCAKRTKNVPSFILGNSGIYALASVLFHVTGCEKESIHYKNLFAQAANILKVTRFLSHGSDELFVGRAGYLCGALWMYKALKAPLPIQDLHEICRVMVTSGRKYSQSHNSPSPLMYAYYDVEYLGAAHGLSSILQMLISIPDYLKNYPTDEIHIRGSVDYLLSLQDKDGNFPASTDEIRNERNELIHWCHGAPGVIYLMAKAYLVWKDEKYLDSCLKMTELMWIKGMLRKGPGLCHGVSGNGYVFLLMYRLTSDVKYLNRAYFFVKCLNDATLKQESRTPDHPYSLFEGVAGTVCFLGDITTPLKASFPFFNIF